MMQLILFYISIFFLLFLPGWFLILAIFGKSNKLSRLEKFIIAPGLSLVSINFLIILIGKSGIPITGKSIIIANLLFLLLNAIIYKTQKNKQISIEEKDASDKLFSFSKKHTVLIILILALTFFIKTVYLSDTIFPTSTDMGHHMYWSKLISQTNELPDYQESDVIQVGENYQISNPKPIADFIIGEHLIFSAINLFSGIDFISYFPTLVLFLFNIFTVLIIFILTLRLFENFGTIQARTINIFALFLAGPIYTLASPQAKFASGGVIGNTFGNFLIPLILYFFLRALEKKNKPMLSLGIFTTIGLFYIHHLSSFVF
ncbi:MAG: hypothetical protein US15_C0040G0001, partial [Candidatus Moranbacteria bacterium GW2011_GWF1_36_4]